MRDTDRLLGDVLDEAHGLHPTPPPFDRVRTRARRRALLRRVAGSAAVVVFAGTVVAVAAGQGGEDKTRVAVTPATSIDDLDVASTTITVPTTVPGEPTTTTAPSRPTRTEPAPPPSSGPTTTTTGVATQPYEGPPAAYISDGDGEVRMASGSYCWRPRPGGSGTCADTVSTFADDAPVVTVVSGGTLTVRWATDEQPTAVRAFARRGPDGNPTTPVAATTANPTRVSVELSPGSYVLFVGGDWQQGDTFHGVRLEVTAAS